MSLEKIALINPPSPFLINDRVFPNLGLVQLATSMKEKGQDVEIIDLCGSENPEGKIREIANEFDIFGFSSTTPQFIETKKIHDTLKEKNPDAKTIIGGAHPSSVYTLHKMGKMDDPNIAPLNKFDYIVVGEGESLDMTNLKEGWNIAPLIKDINESPIPDRSLIDITSYKYDLMGKPTTTIMTQRGCPFSCTFCCGREIDMYRKARSKSPEKVLEELDYLNSEFGFDSFMWFDDEVNVNPKRLFEMSKLLQKRNYQHRGFVRSDLLVRFPDTLTSLVDAGFIELCSGVESGSDEVLKRIKKGTTADMNAKAAQMIMDSGTTYKAFTIIGHPGETYNDVQKTIQWVKDVNPDGFDFSILSPYPGSVLYDHSSPSTKHKGFDREWQGSDGGKLYFKQIDYSKDPSFYKGLEAASTCNIRTDSLSDKDILDIQEEMRPLALKQYDK